MDWIFAPMDAVETADFYEIVVERHRRASTIVTSNREPPEMLAPMADQLLAQSTMDRLQSAAFELAIDGESYRRRQKPTLTTPQGNPSGDVVDARPVARQGSPCGQPTTRHVVPSSWQRVVPCSRQSDNGGVGRFHDGYEQTTNGAKTCQGPRRGIS